MAFGGVRDRVRLEVRHVLDLEAAGGGYRMEYCETVRIIPRPAHDRAEERVSCGHCGEAVRFTVFATGPTRLRRAYAFGIGAALLGAGGLLYKVGAAVLGEASSPLWPLLLLLAIVVLVLLGLAGVFYALLFEFGVRSPRLWRGQPAAPGSHLATFDPLRGGKPRIRVDQLASRHHYH